MKKEENSKNTKLFKIQLRHGFSDRNNIEKQNTIIQTTNFDERTRLCMLNEIKLIFKIIKEKYPQNIDWQTNRFTNFINCMLHDVYVQEINYNIREYNEEWLMENYIKPTIIFDEYNKVLDLIEFIANELTERYLYDDEKNSIYEAFNKIFEEECVGYRFVEGVITPIVNDIEIKTIEIAIQQNKYQPVKKHLRKALSIFSNREKSDYDNVIKESITAVEAMCQIITNNDSATLGDALKDLEKHNIVIHSALKSAFSKLYGYTCNSNGIRHANGIGEQNSTFEEAQFMLVICSAFINYLISNLSKIK